MKQPKQNQETKPSPIKALGVLCSSKPLTNQERKAAWAYKGGEVKSLEVLN